VLRCAGCRREVSEWAARCPACHRDTQDADEVASEEEANRPALTVDGELQPNKGVSVRETSRSRQARLRRRFAVLVVAVAAIVAATLAGLVWPSPPSKAPKPAVSAVLPDRPRGDGCLCGPSSAGHFHWVAPLGRARQYGLL
jgi:hypothetical protein